MQIMRSLRYIYFCLFIMHKLFSVCFFMACVFLQHLTPIATINFAIKKSNIQLSLNGCSVLFSVLYPELFHPVSCKRDICCVFSTCQLGNQGLCSGRRLTTPTLWCTMPPQLAGFCLGDARHSVTKLCRFTCTDFNRHSPSSCFNSHFVSKALEWYH